MQKFINNVKDTWKSGCVGKLVIGFAVFFMCAICNNTIGRQSPPPAATQISLATEIPPTAQEVSATPRHSATPRATDTVAPTDTAGPSPTASDTSTITPTPTKTPTPSKTATASRTPSRTPTADATRAAYAEHVAQTASTFADYLDRFSEQNSKVADDINLLLDQDWIIETALVLSMLKNTADNFIELPAPRRCEGVARFLKQVQSETYLMADQYAKGIDEIDPNFIQSALEHQKKMNEAVRQATAENARSGCSGITPSAPTASP